MLQNQQEEKKKPFFKQPRFILAIAVGVIIVILCVIFKYKVLIPIILLLVMFIAIMVNRKILRQRKSKNSQEILQYNLSDSESSKLTQYFVNRDEKYISSLGNGYIMSYLANGNLSKGFAVISNERVYFRGSCFSGQGKSLVRTNEERTVDIKDVTGSGFTYRRYIGVLLGLFAALMTLIGGICGCGLQLSINWDDTKKFQAQFEDAQDKIDLINDSVKRINNIEEQITENQESIDEMRTKLSELDTLQAQSMSEIEKECISANMDEFLYDTEINIAFEEYLYEMNDIYKQSDFFRYLSKWKTQAQDFRSSRPLTNEQLSRKYKFQEGTASLYDYTLSGNSLIDYYSEHNSIYIEPIRFYIDSVGISEDLLGYTYLILK